MCDKIFEISINGKVLCYPQTNKSFLLTGNECDYWVDRIKNIDKKWRVHAWANVGAMIREKAF